MLFNIPQFIDKEDKIVGPFTAKQLGWMFGGGAILLVLWNILEPAGFFIAAVPVCGAVGALAFYHPNGQPLISFLLSSANFMFHPKVYLWRRIPEKEEKKQEIKKVEVIQVTKKVDSQRIEEISKLLDTRSK